MTSEAALVEARTIDAWFATARLRQSQYTGPMPPRLIAENVRMMAEYMGMTSSAAEAAARSMAFWQMFLPAVFGKDPANFTDVRARLPRSFGLVRDGVARRRGAPAAGVRRVSHDGVSAPGRDAGSGGVRRAW